jgi:hypothetical protein
MKMKTKYEKSKDRTDAATATTTIVDEEKEKVATQKDAKKKETVEKFVALVEVEQREAKEVAEK